MKKVLSFVLVLTLVLGSFSMVFAADAKTVGSQLSDIAGNTNEDAIIANCDLGIITGYTDGTYKPSQAVNRAEFAAMITRMLGVPDSALAGYAKTSFTDMAGYGWANSYIGFCEAKGIVTGYGNGTFGPGNTITVNEAITMVARAIGYTNNSSELVGSWPSNYVSLGKRLGLYDDVSATNVIDRASAAQVIYNALTCTVVAVNADGETKDAYVDKDTKLAKTVIEVYLDCTPTGEIVYTKKLADSSVINTMEYVGAYVKAFLNDDDDVIAIAEVKSVFLTGDWTEADEEFEVGDVTYTLKTTNINYKDSENKTQPTLYFLNGTSRDEHSTTAAFATDGSYTIAAKISGKTIKEVYSITEWKAEEAFLYEADMLDNDDAKLNGYKFVKDDNDNIDVDSFALVGAASLSKIEKDNVVEVFLEDPTDSSSKIVKVAIGTKTVEGKITVEDDGDYTIDKTVYTIAASFSDDKDNLTSASLGDTGKAYLNYDGKIALWEVKDADADNYAIVTGKYAKYNRDYSIILLDKNGVEKEYIVKDDFEFTTSAGITTTSALSVGKLVTFSLDKNGKIDAMTALDMDSANTSQVNKNRTLFGNNKLDSAVVVFTYDKPVVADSDFAVIKLADVETEKDLDGSQYYMDGSSVAVMLIKDKYTGADSIYAVLNSAKESFNADDDKAFVVEGFAGGKAYKAYTSDRNTGALNARFTTVTTVGAYKLTVDANGMITDAEITDGETVANPKLPVNGYVADKDGSYLIKVDKDATTSSAITADDATWYTIDKNAVVYTLEDGEYSVSKLTDVKKKNNSTAASYVYLYQMDDDSEVVDFIIIVK